MMIRSNTLNYLPKNIFILLLLSACEQSKQTHDDDNTALSVPVCDFGVSSPYIAIGEAVHFTDQSTNTPTVWFWEFGDGFISNKQNPQYIYTETQAFTPFHYGFKIISELTPSPKPIILPCLQPMP